MYDKNYFDDKVLVCTLVLTLILGLGRFVMEEGDDEALLVPLVMASDDVDNSVERFIWEFTIRRCAFCFGLHSAFSASAFAFCSQRDAEASA
mmetsp:Transcript_4999/g.7523  ORF Transcript_4999/g.7523 Transcript_4999/m.7523 type:complete len:92 (-) Transcript_4999:1036-1311(-)